MSEFLCPHGHDMSGHEVCPVCGERANRMDGMGNRELMEREEDILNTPTIKEGAHDYRS